MKYTLEGHKNDQLFEIHIHFFETYTLIFVVYFFKDETLKKNLHVK